MKATRIMIMVVIYLALMAGVLTAHRLTADSASLQYVPTQAQATELDRQAWDAKADAILAAWGQ